MNTRHVLSPSTSPIPLKFCVLDPADVGKVGTGDREWSDACARVAPFSISAEPLNPLSHSPTELTFCMQTGIGESGGGCPVFKKT